MSGHVDNLSPAQERLLAQFQENIQDVLSALPNPDDFFLLRWLRARKFDLQASETMLRKHVEFRKQYDLDSILTWQPPEVARMFNSNGICGHDREGSPVWYHIIRGLDPKGMLLSASKQELLRDKFRSCELLLQDCERQSQKLGKRVEKITAIFDFEGLGLKHLWKPGMEFVREFLSALEANYPEILKTIIVLKAPKLFPVAFNLIKSCMNEETHKKFVILGDDWKQELTKFISPDQLPGEFGGTMTDPDGNPKCLTKINYGGEVPKSYYLRHQLRVQYEHTVPVGRGSSLQAGAIGFGVFLKTRLGERQRAGEMTEVLPSQRYNAHLVPEDGSLTCLKTGVYVLRFDNTYSLVHSKHISYTVEVLLPDQTYVEKLEKF
ncbi:Putative SEC14-like protein 6 [Tupaia chinensis]|uniref:Putative SEC14-like protein 6 n=1 Tax=Tupaia chinensis TaxID=246437 RepID=L9KV22_TUPCH|nr:Putative SEC14-like protein 6 [Tupaia chinensis]